MFATNQTFFVVFTETQFLLAFLDFVIFIKAVWSIEISFTVFAVMVRFLPGLKSGQPP